MRDKVKKVLSVAFGFLAASLLGISARAADLDVFRERVHLANSSLAKQVDEVQAKLSGLASPLSLPDADVIVFNAWVDEIVDEERRLHQELTVALGGLAQSLIQEGLPPTALSRYQEVLAQYQARYASYSVLIERFEDSTHRMQPREQGVHTQAEAEREDLIRRNVVVLFSAILSEIEATRQPVPITFQLPPWKDIQMKEREPQSEAPNILPAYLAASAAQSRAKLQSTEGTIAPQSTSSSSAVAVQSADTTQTVDTESNQKIRDLVVSLDHDPIKMYEWVLNNVAYQPYYGSAKGAIKTFYDRAGNDFDTGSLLISLYREAGIPARYVYGNVSLTATQANNLFGTDSAVTAASILAKGGIPVRWDGLNLLVEHCWVEAYVPYDSYRGTRSLPGGDTWVPLDPSFKIYEYRLGLQVARDVHMDWKSFFENGVTQKTAAQLWKEKIAEQLTTAGSGATIEDVPRNRTIREEHLGVLPLSLKVEVKEVHWENAEIADALRHKIQFKYFEAKSTDWTVPTELDVTIPLSRLLSGRITLNWVPATPDDAAIIDRFGGLYRTPSYLIKLKAAVMLEGQVMDTGLPVAVGTAGYLRQYAILPTGVQGASDDYGNLYQVVKKQVSCPSIYGLGFGFQGYADEYVQERIARLQASRESHNYDDVYGEIAYLNAITWYKRAYDSDSEVAALRHFTNYPSQVAMGFSLLGAEVQGMMGGMGAVSASAQSLSLDMVMIWTMTPIHLEQVEEEATKIMGASDSQLEHMVLENYYSVPAVSAVKLIQQAYVDNVPVRNGWVDPSQGLHIFMDGDVRIFNYSGRGRIEGGYLISGGLSGSFAAAKIGVNFPGDSYYFLFPPSTSLNFQTSLTLLDPWRKVVESDLTVVEIQDANGARMFSKNWNQILQRYEVFPSGSQFDYQVVRVGSSNTYQLTLSGIDWGVMLAGRYTLTVKMIGVYAISGESNTVKEFDILNVVPPGLLTFSDNQGNVYGYGPSGILYVPVGKQICVTGAKNLWIYNVSGILMPSAGFCFSFSLPGEYHSVIDYGSYVSSLFGTLTIIVLKVDFTRLSETANPANQIFNGTRKDDPADNNPANPLSQRDANGDTYGTPRNTLYLVPPNPADSKYKATVAADIQPEIARSKIIAAVFSGASKVPGSDKAFDTSGKCNLEFAHSGADVSDFVIRVGIDMNGNSQLDQSEYELMPFVVRNPSNGETIGMPTIRGSSPSKYDTVKSYIDDTINWYARPHASELLRIFRDGNASGVPGEKQPTLPPGSRDLNAFGGPFSEWLTHNSGAPFEAGGQVSLGEYVWEYPSETSTFVGDAKEMREAIKQYYNDTVQAQAMATLPVGVTEWFPPNSGWYDIPHPHSPDWVSWYTVDFHDNNPLTPDVLDDVHGTVGRGRVASHKARFHIMKKTSILPPFDEYLDVDQIRSVGEVVDLYDFNFESVGMVAAAQWAAILQIGYGKGTYGPSRDRGKIFFSRFVFDVSYSGLP